MKTRKLIDPLGLCSKGRVETSGITTPEKRTHWDIEGTDECPVCGTMMAAALALDIPVKVCVKCRVCLPEKTA